MGENYLIDTNVIIDFSEDKLPVKAKAFVASIIDNTPYFSVINKIELLGVSATNAIISELVDISTIIGLTDPIITRTIAIRKRHRIKLPDAIIAATAIEEDLILVTRNVSDFKNIKGLRVVNQWDK